MRREVKRGRALNRNSNAIAEKRSHAISHVLPTRNSKGPPGRPGLQVHGRAGLDYSSVHFNACTRITREAAESSGYSGSSNTKQFQSKDDVNVTAATKYDYYIGANVSGPQRYASLETRRSLENVISCDHYSNKPDLLRPLLRGERSIRRLQTAVSRVRT